MTPKIYRAIDVSSYQTAMPWGILMSNGVCDIAIIKGGQGQYTRDHVNQARAAGIKIIMLYFWADPTITAFYQILVASNDIKEHLPDAVWIDSEQWWADWSQYWEFLAGKRTLANMLIKSPQSISDNSLAILNGLRTNFPSLPLGDYSADWFVRGWAQPMSTWLRNWWFWVAAYRDYGQATFKTTYDFIKSVPLYTESPLLPSGVTEYAMWQYSSRMIYPDQAYPFDSNVLNMNSADFLKAIGLDNTVPPVDPNIDELKAEIVRLQSVITSWEMWHSLAPVE